MQFSIKDMFRASWSTFKKNAWTFVGATAIIGVASLGIDSITENSDDIFRAIVSIAGTVFLWWLTVGFLRMALDAYAGGTPSVRMLFVPSGNMFWHFVVANVLGGLAFGFGLILLIIPGIIIGIGFMFAPLFVIENGARGVEALRASWNVTKGRRWNLLLVCLSLFGLNVLGALALGLGLLVTTPMTAIALVYVYRELEKKTQPEAAPAAPQVVA